MLWHSFGLELIAKYVPEKKNWTGQLDESNLEISYAVVTPLHKAASYEQRKTNLGSSP